MAVNSSRVLPPRRCRRGSRGFLGLPAAGSLETAAGRAPRGGVGVQAAGPRQVAALRRRRGRSLRGCLRARGAATSPAPRGPSLRSRRLLLCPRVFSALLGALALPAAAPQPE